MEEFKPDLEEGAGRQLWRRLLHRWLVQYNPLYLLSASLCLGGMILCSRGLAREGSLHGELWVAAIAELYAAALIAGAALLTRIGQRRPAVMLALLTALYQCDLTLHTEAAACLGATGVAASAAWLVLFVGKLHALAWAVRLRLSLPAKALATGGALGLAVLPHNLPSMDARGASAVVSFWVFALLALGLHGARTVVSTVALDAWGRTVLRRSLRAVWLLWSLLLLSHVLFWSTSYPVRVAALAPVPLLLASRALRREAHVWVAVTGTLLVVSMAMPEHFAVSALMAAATLASRAARRAETKADVDPASPRSPYRALDSYELPGGAASPQQGAPHRAVPTPAERRRLLLGALLGAYLALWTLAWTGGPWPAHQVALDLALTVAVLLLVARTRRVLALAPLILSYGHFAVETRVVSAPRSVLGWGTASVGLGFTLLLASLAASYWLRNEGKTRDPAHDG